MPDHQFVLTLSCPDRPGIVSAVSTFLAHNGQNILDAQQFDDIETKRFFMRVVFTAADLAVALSALQTGFTAIADRFGMDWQMRDRASRRRVMLLVSKSDHCLVDILYRWRTGELGSFRLRSSPTIPMRSILSPMAPKAFRSTTCRSIRPTSSARSRRCCASSSRRTRRSRGAGALHADLVGRDGGKFAGRCINIHHSFLPGFKGAKAYHQAHARGVKIIGATAHYVTGDLDEGPIIEQAVERVDHARGRRRSWRSAATSKAACWRAPCAIILRIA